MEKITKKTKTIIISGVIALAVVAGATSVATNGFNGDSIGGAKTTTLVCIDPPGT